MTCTDTTLRSKNDLDACMPFRVKSEVKSLHFLLFLGYSFEGDFSALSACSEDITFLRCTVGLRYLSQVEHRTHFYALFLLIMI